MNDRFKFRYWHTKENKYINTQCDCLAICNSCLQSIRDIPDVRGWYNTVLDQAYNDFELIPEQCTGLKDNCGNLIYEGDIIGDGEDDYVIKWDSNRTMFVAEDVDTLYEIEDILDPTICVIGNVHETQRIYND